MRTVYAKSGDTVDYICWRYYGRTELVTEAVLTANPNLAEYGPVLPHGTAVQLPDIPQQKTQRDTVKLWD